MFRLLARGEAEFFINRCCWIRDFQRGVELKFTERPIQAALRELIQHEKLVAGLKAREVGWTWELALLALWECWALAPYQCIYLAQREDNAHEFIRRIRWAHGRLPEWLGYPRQQQPETKDRFAITTREGQESEVLAFPSVPTAAEGWHPRRFIADQWGLIGEKVLPSALGAIGLDGYFVGLDTAQGLGNEFADVYISCRDGYPELYAGDHPSKRFHHIFASWRDNPDFRQRPSAGTQKDTERMYPESDREPFALAAPGEAVYPEFVPALHVAQQGLEADPLAPMIRGWDFGYQRPACVVFQLGGLGQTAILAEHLGHNEDVATFGRRVVEDCNLRWPRARWSDWGDPSGRAHRETDAKSCFKILRAELGLDLQPGKASWQPRRRAVASRLTRIVNGRPALVVDPTCTMLIEGFEGMYHYPAGRGPSAQLDDAFRERREELRARATLGARR